MKSKGKQTIKNVYQLLDWRQKASFAVILFFMAGSAVLTQITPKAIGWITDDILGQKQLSILSILPALLLILGANLMNELFQLLRRILVEDTATKTEKKARGLVITALLKAPLSYFKENMTGYIHGRLNRCLEGTVKLEKLLFMDFAPAIFNSIAAVVVIFTTLPVMLACLMLLVIPVGVAIVYRQISTQKGIRVELLETKSAMDGSVVELLNGIEVIRMADSAGAEEKRIDEKSEFLRKKEMRHHVQMAKYDSLKFLNEVVFTVLMIGISAYLAMEGKISVGEVLTSYLCFSQLITPLEELHRILDELSESMILAEDFFKMAQIPRDFSYLETGKTGGRKEDSPFLVDIRNLGFSYDQKEYILKDVNLQIKRGSFLGIAGPSGCGKSSLIKAICRLEDCEGDIFLDGENIRQMSRAELSRLIALVPQNPFLVAGTVYENICYGLKRTPSRKEVEEAVKKACLSDFVNSLPEGLDTYISEKGENLSGGQRQRISIARIFLRKPKILILDEATSALDNVSERIIQGEIEALKREYGTTILSIAHRLTTLENCDRILVMDGGSIVQEGKYRELVETEGIFHEMYYGRLS